MFEYLFAQSPYKAFRLCSNIKKEYASSGRLVPLLWTEHCIECSAPLCYTTCPRFQKRADGHCIRFNGGVSPLKIETSVTGAELNFRSWAKLETQFKAYTISSKKYISTYKKITIVGAFFNRIARLCPFQSISHLIDAALFSLRQKYINRIAKHGKQEQALSLYLKVENGEQSFPMLIDVKSESKHIYRTAIDVPNGTSEFKIAIPPYSDPHELYFLNIHPVDADSTPSIAIYQLELMARDITEGKKIKCVIWDLDNTLWEGTLIEDKHVRIKPELVALIKHFDSCGIVNSIVSKNNKEEVNIILEQTGLSEYFVFPKINWLPKSVNINKIVQQMNINPDTILFVDDNPFELNEVSMSLPEITCIEPQDVVNFSKCERFNMVITSDSRKRRSTYKMLEAMILEEENWEGNIDDFLISCKIKLTISKPTESEIPRCFELLQRTNQLNSSGRRLSLEEVREFAYSDNADCYVLRSADKFGDYGIVGFVIIEKNQDKRCITDFVISCRVANKKIEPTLVNYFSGKYGGEIYFDFKKTTKNGPMFNIIVELNMTEVSSSSLLKKFKVLHNDDYPEIVEIVDLT